MTPDEAADLAARTLAAIDYRDGGWGTPPATAAADRERVESDLAGLREHPEVFPSRCRTDGFPCADARRYADGLRRTAALYGATP